MRGEPVDKRVKTFTCFTRALYALSLTESCDLFTMYTMQEQPTDKGEGDFMEERAKNFLNPRTTAKVNTAKNH